MCKVIMKSYVGDRMKHPVYKSIAGTDLGQNFMQESSDMNINSLASLLRVLGRCDFSHRYMNASQHFLRIIRKTDEPWMNYARRIDTAYKEIRDRLKEKPDKNETFSELQSQFIKEAPYIPEITKALLSTCSSMRQLITVAEQEQERTRKLKFESQKQRNYNLNQTSQQFIQQVQRQNGPWRQQLQSLQQEPRQQQFPNLQEEIRPRPQQTAAAAYVAGSGTRVSF
jgi:chromosome segregation ATPase